MKARISLILLLSSSAWADCRYHNGTGFVTIPDGQTVSLFEEGKSLANHRVQDQDGLGTCYANATSAALKTVLPGNPDVSYAHAAVAASSVGWNPALRTSGGFNRNNENFVNGGFVCDTVAALKRQGGACPVGFSITENKSLMDPYVQQRLFNGLGTYFDTVNTLRNNPEDLAKLRQDLTLAMELINNERANLLRQCEEEKREELPVTQAVSDFISTEVLSLDDSKCSERKRNQIKALLKPESVLEKDRAVIKPTPALVQQFRALVESDESLKLKIIAYTKDRNALSNVEFDNVNKALGEKMAALWNRLVPDQCTEEELQGNPQPPVNENREWAGQIFMSNMEQQVTKPCEHLLSQAIQINDDAKQCAASPHFESIMAALSPLTELGNRLDATTLEGLMNTTRRNAEQLNQFLFPECRGNNLLPMNDVSCATFTMCAQSVFDSRLENQTYTGAPGTECLSPERGKSEMRLRVINNVLANKSPAITVCTGFMQDANVKTNYCKNAPPGVPNHGFHVMTVSGYRCSGNKIEYQVLNSWGASHCPDAAANSDKVKCDTTEEGFQTGRFWVDEEVLVDSTTGISQLSRQPQPARGRR